MNTASSSINPKSLYIIVDCLVRVELRCEIECKITKQLLGNVCAYVSVGKIFDGDLRIERTNTVVNFMYRLEVTRVCFFVYFSA